MAQNDIPTWDEAVAESNEVLLGATTAPAERLMRTMMLGSIASAEGHALQQQREARKAALRQEFEKEKRAALDADLRYFRSRHIVPGLGYVPQPEETAAAAKVLGTELGQAGKDVRRSLEAASLLAAGTYQPRGSWRDVVKPFSLPVAAADLLRSPETLQDVAKQLSVPRGATPEQLAEYPYQQGLAQLPEWAQMAAEVPGGIAEISPKLAGVAALQMAGVPAPIAGGLLFGLTEEGFNPQEAAVGAAIPYVGKYAGQLTRALAKELGISSKASQNLLAAIAHGGGATAYLGTITASEIAGMAPEDRMEAVKKALPSSIGMLLMTVPGMKAELERGTPQQLAKLLNQAALRAGYRPRVPDRRLGWRMQPMDQPFADPEVQALADEALRQRMSGLVIPPQASALGKLQRQLQQQVVPAPGGRTLAERTREAGETLVRPTAGGLRVEPGFERTAGDLLLERAKPEPMRPGEPPPAEPTAPRSRQEHGRELDRLQQEYEKSLGEMADASKGVPPKPAPLLTQAERVAQPEMVAKRLAYDAAVEKARRDKAALDEFNRRYPSEWAKTLPEGTTQDFRAAQRQTGEATKAKGKTKTQKTMDDYERYQAARGQLRDMRERLGMAAFRSPEYMAIVGEMERIKNRHGGMPPTKPSPVTEGKAEPKPVPPAAPAGVAEAQPGAVTAAPVGQAISEATVKPEVTQAPISGAAPEFTSRTVVPQGITATAATVRRQFLEQYPHLRGMVENGEIVFTEGKESWPENVRKASGSESFEAVYLTNTKQVVFDASMFTGENAAKLAEIVVHEVAIHKGLRAALGEKLFTRTTIDIWGNLSGKERAKILARIREDYPNTDPLRQIAGEEWLAYEAQRVTREGVTTTLWTKIADGIRKALRAMGFKRSLSDTEIAAMIEKGWEGIKTREKAEKFEVPEYEKQGPSMEDGTVPQRYSISSAKIKYYDDYVGKWTQDEQRVLGFLPQLASLDAKFWNWVQKTEKSTVRNISAWNKFLDSHPQELSQMRNLARDPAFADMLHPNGKLRATPMELREGGALNFHRNLPQMFLDRINPDTWMSIQNKMVEGVEHAYLLKRSQGTLPMKIVGLSEDAGLGKVAAESKEYRIQTPIRTAEKTVAAVNLNSACPEWVVGNRGCWVDACYLSQMARGNGVNLFERAMYTGEILQLSDAAVKELREVGLRVNGVGDTIATNVKPMQDIIRHAGMRGIPIKIITKQEMSFKAVQDAAAKGQDVSHVVVQPSIDYWWRKVADDMADKGAGAREIAGGDKERIAKLLGRRDPQAEAVIKEIYAKFGKEVKLINGQWYRKDGFTWDQVNEFKQKYPDVKVLPRMVVGSTAEIMDAVMNHPDAVITFLHGKMDPSIVSDFAGVIHNYGAARHWFYWDPTANKAVIRGEKNSPEFWGMRKGLITKEGYTALEQEINKLPLAQRRKAFKNLERQTCCQENDSPDACADCAAHCALRTIYSAEDIKANQVGPLNKPGATGTPEARMGVPGLTAKGLSEASGEPIELGAEPEFRAASQKRIKWIKAEDDASYESEDGAFRIMGLYIGRERPQRWEVTNTKTGESFQRESLDLAKEAADKIANPNFIVNRKSYAPTGTREQVARQLQENYDYFKNKGDYRNADQILKNAESVGIKLNTGAEPGFRAATREQDREYLDAVARGDTQKAQSMVDEAAKRAGYAVGPVFHGSLTPGIEEKFTVFNREKQRPTSRNIGFWFTTDEGVRESYALRNKEAVGHQYDVYLKLDNPFDLRNESKDAPSIFAAVEALKTPTDVVNGYLKWAREKAKSEGTFLGQNNVGEFSNFADYVSQQLARRKVLEKGRGEVISGKLVFSNKADSENYGQLVANNYREILKSVGYDGMIMPEEHGKPNVETYVVFEPNQIKSVEPVTRDNAGNVIPLSERFQSTSPDFRAAKTLADARKIFEEKPKPKQPVRLVGRVRSGFFSEFHPLDELAKMVADANGYTKPKQIAHIFEQLKGSRGKGEAEVYRFDRDVGKVISGQEKNFNVFMFANRTLDRLAQDAREGITRRKVSDWTIADANRVLRELEAEVGADTFRKFGPAAAKYQQYMDRALLLQVESGRMSRQQYDLIKAGNQFYAPFKVMKHIEIQERPEGTGKKVDTMADYTKAMEGIEDPDLRLGDMMAAGRQALLTSRILADKAVAMRHISDLAVLDAKGTFVRKMFKSQNPREGFSAVNVYENGKVFKYEVPMFVAQALQTLGPASNGPYVKWLSRFATPFRVGATMFNVPFQVSNAVADVPRAALVSKYGIRAISDAYRYPIEFVEAIYSSIGANVFGVRNKLYYDFLDSGAAGSSIQEYLMPKALLGKKSPAKTVFANTLGKLGDFAQALEQTSKVLGVKRAMRFEKVKSGAELAKLVPEAITEIRRFSGSPDFGRQGKWTQQARLNLVLMFMNARVQGSAADIGRLVGMDGAKTAAFTWARLITAVGLPTVLLYLFNNSSDDLREGYKQRSDFEKRNYWLIPKDTFITTEDGERIRDYWRIPKRESAKWVANLSESALKFAEKKDPEAFKEFTVTMLEDISPVNIEGDTAQERLESMGASLNPMFKVWIEMATGKDMYRHQMIIPEIMRGAGTPELQYKERTPELFKWGAEMMPDIAPSVFRSPLMLENITKNLTAGLITQWLPKKPIEGRGPIENFPLLQRFQAMPYIDTEQKQKLIDELKGEAVDDYLIRHRKAQKYLEDNKGADLETVVGKAYEAGDLQDVKLANHLVDLWVAKQLGVNAVERRLIALPAEQRAKFVLKALSEKTGEEREKLYVDWVQKRVLTEATLFEMMKQDPEGKMLPAVPGVPMEAAPREIPTWEDIQPVNK